MSIKRYALITLCLVVSACSSVSRECIMAHTEHCVSFALDQCPTMQAKPEIMATAGDNFSNGSHCTPIPNMDCPVVTCPAEELDENATSNH